MPDHEVLVKVCQRKRTAYGNFFSHVLKRRAFVMQRPAGKAVRIAVFDGLTEREHGRSRQPPYAQHVIAREPLEPHGIPLIPPKDQHGSGFLPREESDMTGSLQDLWPWLWRRPPFQDHHVPDLRVI